MPPIYVSRQGAQVTLRRGRLRVFLRDEVLLDVPLEEVDQLTVLGRGVQVTTAALAALIARGVEVAYLTRYGRLIIRGPLNGAVTLRLAQARRSGDPAEALAVAREFVGAKLANQADLLDHWGRGPEAARIRRRRGELGRAATPDELRGFEGVAANAYFRAFGALLPAEWGFRRRLHHPPPDPINALLSFGYTLLLNEVIGRVDQVGLDPYVGFLHAIQPGRPSFALDLEEEFRPLIDDLVLGLCLRRELGPDDFVVTTWGSRLTDPARKLYLLAYERQIRRRVSHPLSRGRVDLRLAIELQIRRVGRLLQGSAPEPYEAVRLAELWPAR